MNVFKAKKDSWHYKIIQKHIQWEVPYISKRSDWNSQVIEHVVSRDFCSYFRGVFLYLLKFFFWMMGAGVIVLGVFGWILTFIGGLIESPLIALSMVFVFLISCAFVSFLFVFSVMYIIRIYSKGRGGSSEPSLIQTKYKSWKEKYCPAIEFK